MVAGGGMLMPTAFALLSIIASVKKLYGVGRERGITLLMFKKYGILFYYYFFLNDKFLYKFQPIVYTLYSILALIK